MKDITTVCICRKLCLLIVFAQIVVAPARAQHYWQQQVNFLIDVTLDDSSHSLDAYEKITYVNRSPDTLAFIWFHIWPNAYKNDRTAFSEQLLRNGRTDFYFSNQHQRGYINRLDFKVNGVTAMMEDHPEHIDIVKVILPTSLPPGNSIVITTPFHVQLPENFSRGGHKGQSYQITQWFPKPVVYDAQGWHPMPYLDQGEFYSEFGDYDVRVTVPSNYIVAATGVLQDDEEKKRMRSNSSPAAEATLPARVKAGTKAIINPFPATAPGIKTLRFIQENVHDFAWFADKRFIVHYDTLQLASGRTIDVFSYHLPASESWKNSIGFLKDAIKWRSSWVGEYPYNVVSAIEAEMGVQGGMEYPTITSISPMDSEKEVDLVIEHEVGHNWFQGLLANNERRYAWMDEGMNSYYDERYEEIKYQPGTVPKQTFLSKRVPASFDGLLFETMAAMKLDQPVNTSSEDFSEINYGLESYHKTSVWMKQLEEALGRRLFDSCMRTYYSNWQFKHPQPADFKATMEQVSGRILDTLFTKLNETGTLNSPVKKKTRLTSYFNLKETDKYQYISIAPAIGYNMYDGLQVGALIHNYQLPLPRLQFLAAPLYGISSKKLNGLARASYNWYPSNKFQKVEAGAAYSAFSMDNFQKEAVSKTYLRFRKLAPFLRVHFRKAPVSTISRSAQFKWYFISEDALNFKQVITGIDTTDVISSIKHNNGFAEIKYKTEDQRALYPWKTEWSVQYHKDFVRLMFTGNYFYNYSSNKGGIKVRWFGGKFLYTGASNLNKRFATDRYHLTLTGARGYEDYTYSNYFIGRNEFQGIGSQQLMMRDGGFKVGTDLLDAKVGKSDDWLAALNFTIHIPDLSDHLPVKLFLDLGTYSEAWAKNAEGSRMLYDAGLQLSLFKETINIYVPVFYSSTFKNYFRSTLGDNRLLKTIAFSIDLQDLNLRKISKEIPF